MTAEGIVAPGKAERDGEPKEPTTLPAQGVFGNPEGALKQVWLLGDRAGPHDKYGN